ncbi:MAG: hypothetical protein ACTHJ0_04230 [Flavipsychrobacter sp.]
MNFSGFLWLLSLPPKKVTTHVTRAITQQSENNIENHIAAFTKTKENRLTQDTQHKNHSYLFYKRKNRHAAHTTQTNFLNFYFFIFNLKNVDILIWKPHVNNHILQNHAGGPSSLTL